MTLNEIKTAIDQGHRVKWSNDFYDVIKDGLGQYLIIYQPNGHCIGLYGNAGQLNGEPSQFYIKA